MFRIRRDIVACCPSRLLEFCRLYLPQYPNWTIVRQFSPLRAQVFPNYDLESDGSARTHVKGSHLTRACLHGAPVQICG